MSRRIVLKWEPLTMENVLLTYLTIVQLLIDRDPSSAVLWLTELWTEGEKLACEAHLSRQIGSPKACVEIFW